MLGCQILVKHFTLGGCNAEREGDRSQALLTASASKARHAPSSPLFRG